MPSKRLGRRETGSTFTARRDMFARAGVAQNCKEPDAMRTRSEKAARNESRREGSNEDRIDTHYPMMIDLCHRHSADAALSINLLTEFSIVSPMINRFTFDKIRFDS